MRKYKITVAAENNMQECTCCFEIEVEYLKVDENLSVLLKAAVESLNKNVYFLESQSNEDIL